MDNNCSCTDVDCKHFKARLFKEARDKYKSEDLDSFVHELKAQEAANINNSGDLDQLEYMLDKGGKEWFMAALSLTGKVK